MAATGLLGAGIPVPGLSTFFDSPSLSDVTIRCRGESIRAHKIVLAQASSHFKRIFETMSSASVVLNLDKHDPKAIKGIIAHIYGLSTNHTGDVLPFGTTYTLKRDHHCEKYAIHQVNLFVAAFDYTIGSLIANIIYEFPTMLRTITHTAIYPTFVDAVACHVYAQQGYAATLLREPIVDHLLEHIGRINKQPAFKTLLLEVPELAFELVQAQDAAKEPAAKEHAGSAPAKPIELLSPLRTTTTGEQAANGSRKRLSRSMLANSKDKSPKRVRITSPVQWTSSSSPKSPTPEWDSVIPKPALSFRRDSPPEI